MSETTVEDPIAIRIPTVLRRFSQGHATVDVSAGTVLDAITELTKRYPSLKNHLFTEDGSLRSFVNIYVDDEDVRHRDGVATTIRPGEVLSIVPAVAGGSER